MAKMNWTPGNIFDVRGKNVIDRNGNTLFVELYSEGWKVGKDSKMDVWNACYILNQHECVAEVI